MASQITKELQATLIANPEIEKVYFDDKGRHYLHAYDLIADPKSDKKAKYGRGEFGFKRKIPGEFNIDGFTEVIAKGKHDTKITSELSREQVLSHVIKKESKLLSEILSLPQAELDALRGALSQQQAPKTSETTPKVPTPPDTKRIQG